MIFDKIIRTITQQDKIDNLNNQIILKDEMLNSLKAQNQKLISDANFKNTEEHRADFWNNKFEKTNVVYRAEDEYLRDVRTFLIDKSRLLQEVLDKNRLVSNNNYETIYNIEQWVIKNIKYKPDIGEWWKEPEITLQDLFGDCEDGALLIKSFCLLAGIPDYLIKVVAGNAENPSNLKDTIGHCYCIVLRDDQKWTILDWSYFPSMLPIDKRIEHKQNSKYKDIWFTFTKEFGFADKEIEIEGRVKKHAKNQKR